MIDVFDALDQAETDTLILSARESFETGELEVDEFEQQVGTRLNQLLFADEWARLAKCQDDLRYADHIERMHQANLDRLRLSA